MTENLTQRITRSFESDINNALLIRGKSGIGKTYYIKHTLFPEVRKTQASTSIHDENCYPVLISLFGLRSVEEIQEQLFLELLPLLRDKTVHITSDARKFLTKLFCKIDVEQFLNKEQSLLEVLPPSENKSVSIFSKIGRFLIKLFSKNEDTSSTEVNILLCFDDLNRTSDALPSKELFGFINSILENTPIKVLLVETDDELSNVAIDYSLMKEKVISNSMLFETNFPLVYEHIITEKYKEKLPSYFYFLQDRSQDVVSKIEESNSNLTTLLFFLDHYEVIFTSIEEVLQKDDKPALSKDSYFDRTINYALSISIEFKKGRLTPSIIFGLKHKDDESNSIKTPFDGELTPKERELYEALISYQQNYEEKYLSNIKYQPIAIFNSIFDYIVGSSFINENLVNELKPHRVVNNYPVFNKLFELEGLDLPMSEIENLIDEMLILVDNAEFHLGDYASVFTVVTRFFYTPRRVNMILKNEKDIHEDGLTEAQKKLIKRFKKGIDTWVLQYNSKDYPEFNVHLGEINFRLNELHSKNPFKKEGMNIMKVHQFDFNVSSNEINMYCQEVYHTIKKQNENKEVKSLLALYEKDMMAFIEKISDPTTRLKNYPIYSKFDFTEFWSIFKNAKNSQLVAFGLHLEQRYKEPLSHNLNAERPFFLTLGNKLKEEKEKFKNPLYIDFDEVVIHYLLKELNRILS
ncbi:hypothetical protein H2O64_08720 [Kordia sp. YSTF-M3]|uniref:KAP NTPase domain-containing protein n=1 Tax=Kordia aestuariivivens TaxID=2759037 RepID=A0ABR7Q852_9FLAO|nr:hypothetical protein [Kordia aestuariivivens]MBC8754751.1 hypothetical protein [Kordia aestuariivivens]